jgi:Domain of unknown function (DUF4160)
MMPCTHNSQAMPKLYEYCGIRVFFYANEHEPVHVHGFRQGRESKGEIIIVNGVIVSIRVSDVAGRRPLTGGDLENFTKLVEAKAEDIVAKWVDFFVHRRHIDTEVITRRLP